MQVSQTGFPGLVVLEPKVFRDHRGFFVESYNRKSMEAIGLRCDFVQDNHAFSKEQFVLRGLHFQKPPAAQAKLVWVTQGGVLDVAVDIRRGSPTFGKAYTTELTGENQRRLFIPRGFAHAYLTLKPDTHFFYKVDSYYSPENDSGIFWDDPGLGIDWAAYLDGTEPVLSDKDKGLPLLAETETPFTYEESA